MKRNHSLAGFIIQKNIHKNIREFFNNSTAQFASFFTTETNLSEKDLKELKKIIDQQLVNKSKKK